MKKLLFIIFVLFSCERGTEPKECWKCIDQYGTNPINETRIVCDAVDAALLNGKKHYYDAGKWHSWTCTPQ